MKTVKCLIAQIKLNKKSYNKKHLRVEDRGWSKCIYIILKLVRGFVFLWMLIR